jgi:hypothetical protein
MGDEHFSNFLARVLLNGYTRASYDIVHPYLEVMMQLLQIMDTNRIQRYHMILGVPHLKFYENAFTVQRLDEMHLHYVSVAKDLELNA